MRYAISVPGCAAPDHHANIQSTPNRLMSCLTELAWETAVQRRKVFNLCYGLPYTKFAFSNLSLPSRTIANGDLTLTATLTLSNTGLVTGSEVVHLYVSMPTPSELMNPPLASRAQGVHEGEGCQIIEARQICGELLGGACRADGEHAVRIGRSSALEEATFGVEKGFECESAGAKRGVLVRAMRSAMQTAQNVEMKATRSHGVHV
ncbi:uncharacterized protein LAESUDRAFT_761952 [Laetiporus sulphureus 93-53]|uniref:Fibronectin type III-like domain-containing protein n=1 Tax=Laetiporus sulphureus 93-53 TaxID=1314785 RepID=A0A165CSS4_9APHY|nr:uncharacterized protein LAESUDRAFT_761952 [Laetiporus sulphureus 93-53]KZT03373.1 hypothetical protein LAESUDRAFT_761952 [Laetiporus sulphureus 93-53]